MYELAKMRSPLSVTETAGDVVRKYWRLLTLHGHFLETNVNESYDLFRRTIICLFIAIPALASGITVLVASVCAQILSSVSAIIVPDLLLFVLYGSSAVLLVGSGFLLFYVRDNLNHIGQSVKDTLGDISKDFERVNDLV